MVKPPKIRHSKLRNDPVTINLDPADVTRQDDRTTAGSAESDAVDVPPTFAAEDPVTPNAADESLASVDEPAKTEIAATETPAAEAAPVEETGVYGRAGTGSAGMRTVEPRRSTAMPALAAGLAGAVIALAGAAGLQWAGFLPATRSESAAVDTASIDVLGSEIDALKQQLAAGDGAADPALAQSLGESNSRIDAIAAAVDQLRADLGAQQTQASAADPAALQALEARLSELESAAGAAAENQTALDAVDGQMTELAGNLRSATETNAAQAGRLDVMEQRLAEMAKRVEAQAAEPGMALAIAATSLKSAIDRGTPFMMELETYAAIAPDDLPQIAALRDMAASGVPTRAGIEAEIADAASLMIAAASPALTNASFMERLYSSAQSLVEVRPVGTVDGQSAAASVARMEVALRAGDYAEAVEEYQSLPEPAQAAGQEFIAKVQARLAADRLLAEALAGALKTPANEG